MEIEINMKRCITFKHTADISEKDIRFLFDSVSWEIATPGVLLKNAIKNSSHIVTAWDDNKLVGIIRSLDDNLWSAVIDTLVVHSNYQKQGIGTALVSELLKDLKHIGYIYVAPNEKVNVPLYTRCGFELVENGCLLQIMNND